jgi:YVTN family beta-propeller protein
LATCCFDSCGVPAQPGTPAGGFPVTTYSVTEDTAGDILSTGVVSGTAVSGNWVSGGTGGSVKSFAVTTDDNGNAYVSNGVVNADWTSTVGWAPVGCPAPGSTTYPFYVNPVAGVDWICLIFQYTEEANTSTHFVLPNAVPSTITSYGDFSTTYGEPQLRVYVGGTTPGFVSGVSASSVVPGVSAVFPFPKQSNGSPLAQGFYSLVNTNVASGGDLIFVNPSYLAVGGTTTLSSAFGVDAADIVYTTVICTRYGCNPPTSVTYSAPILTQYYSGTVVSYTGKTIPVGSEPVAIKGYGSYTSTSHSGFDAFSTTGPANAIVANSGSSSVSIVSFSTNTDLKNIAVGAKPMALTLNSAATYAYVASYGSGTLAEIDLSTEAVARTATGLAGALSVAMDPGGSYVWVGGTNYLYKVSLSTFAVSATVPVAGSVTSLAASNAQNELVYTLVENCCSASSTYAANELLLSNLTTSGSYAHADASPYAPYTMEGTLPTAAALPQASSVVSARFSNGMAASATPTGFVIYDVISHQQLMTGTTPTPVRGIASDPDSMYAYFTLPDSNEYIAVPLESTP